MCLTEYNEAQILELYREEAREEARMEGRAEGRVEEKHEYLIRNVRKWAANPQAAPKDLMLYILEIPESLFDRIADFLARHPFLNDTDAAEQFPW